MVPASLMVDRRALPVLLLIFACVSGCETAPDLYDRLTTVTIATGEAQPRNLTRIRFFPDSNEFLLTSKGGSVRHFRLDGDTATELGSFRIPAVAPAPSDLGLTEVIFDPDFASNQKVYFCFSTGDNQWNRIVQLRWGARYKRLTESLSIVLDVDRIEPPEAWHGIFSLVFGEDGYLYTALGDANQPRFSQDPQSLLGKVLRIEPLDGGGYRIPGDNPYVGNDEIRDEIIAFGLRSPFRMVPWGSSFLIGDVGTDHFEEINLLSEYGQNFGWPECEGPCRQRGFTDPVIAIERQDDTFTLEDTQPSGSQQTSISLGLVYENRDDNDPYEGLLDGYLIFSDVFLGYVRAAKMEHGRRTLRSQHVFHQDGITSMDIGPDGYIYGTTFFQSKIFRIVLKPDTLGAP